MSGASSARRASRQNNPYETPPLSPFPGTETHLALSHNSRSTSQQFGEEPFSDSAVIHGDKVEVRVRHGSSRRNSPASSALRRSRQELPAFTGNDSPYSFSGGSSLSVSHNQVLLLQEGEESDGDFPNQGNLPGDLVASETAVYSERKAKGRDGVRPQESRIISKRVWERLCRSFCAPTDRHR
ncbi:hypothetical protein ADEAN_000516900 [Angomonas deanei]|uniref:Uncharacterized protein n=1 Tax=Angomonas deanei TaxID=59799 RepID=A0A7G2CDW4_9TRYP|nr:hypothetical protein ADEAN_000516900 [Angomonas deanei]